MVARMAEPRKSVAQRPGGARSAHWVRGSGLARSRSGRWRARPCVGHTAEPLLPSAFVHGTDSCPDVHAPGHLSERIDPLAKTPRAWTGARTPSGLKRVRQAERRHAI